MSEPYKSSSQRGRVALRPSGLMTLGTEHLGGGEKNPKPLE
jgi:hypothetical protein